MPPRSADPNLLVGTETSDDAGVYLLPDGSALVQTLDFFPPLVDDPFVFGQIAAANALSDVYAMNGRPLTAMNIVGFPDNELPLSILAEILRGAADRVTLAGAVTVGGHSVRDGEIKFGLSVTGIVDPKQMTTNASARVGDVLVLTKPLGTAFITTANKKEECPEQLLAAAIASMIELNAVGRDAARATSDVHAVTDVTGFGLAGHASEMADAAGVTIRLIAADLPRFVGIEPLLNARYHTRASRSNRDFLQGRLVIEEGAEPDGLELAFDAQTSGGLLISVSPEHADALTSALRSRNASAASVVGRVEPRRDAIAVVIA
ncbi:MAG: selD [Planctomycetota bacterium]|nr:selD [Planctomycetota bacterium]